MQNPHILTYFLGLELTTLKQFNFEGHSHYLATLPHPGTKNGITSTLPKSKDSLNLQGPAGNKSKVAPILVQKRIQNFAPTPPGTATTEPALLQQPIYPSIPFSEVFPNIPTSEDWRYPRSCGSRIRIDNLAAINFEGHSHLEVMKITRCYNQIASTWHNSNVYRSFINARIPKRRAWQHLCPGTSRRNDCKVIHALTSPATPNTYPILPQLGIQFNLECSRFE